MDEYLHELFRKFNKNEEKLEMLQKEQDMIKFELEREIIRKKLVEQKFSVGKRWVVYKKIPCPMTLTQTYLSKCLDDYYPNHPEEADKLYDYIMDHHPRRNRYALEITRKPGTVNPIPSQSSPTPISQSTSTSISQSTSTPISQSTSTPIHVPISLQTTQNSSVKPLFPTTSHKFSDNGKFGLKR